MTSLLGTASHAPRRITILHLEDNNVFLDIFSELISAESRGVYEVKKAPTIEKAKSAIASGIRPDLILADLKLGGNETGLDFLRDVGAEFGLGNIPKVVLSDLSRSDISISGHSITDADLDSAGVSDYIEKKEVYHPGGIQDIIERFQSYTEPSAEVVPTHEAGLSHSSQALLMSDAGFRGFQVGLYGLGASALLTVIASRIDSFGALLGSLAILVLFALVFLFSVLIPSQPRSFDRGGR